MIDPDVVQLALIEAAERGPEALAAVKDYLAANPDATAGESAEAE